MSSRRQRAVEARFRRLAGASPEAREHIAAANMAHSDWEARCPKCGKVLTGSLAEIQGHTCG